MRLLVYAINGRGMGHLNRTLVLSRAMQQADASTQIQFVVRSPLFGMVQDAGFEVIKIPDNHHRLGRFALRSGAQAHTAELFDAILSFIRPDCFLIDFVVEPKLFAVASKYRAKLALILRAQRAAELERLAKKRCVSKVRHFLLPHDTDELPLSQLPAAWRERAVHVGPLARTLDPARVSLARARYASKDERLIVVAIGGGGFKESTKTLLLAEQAAPTLQFDAAGRRVRWVIVYGPYYPDRFAESDEVATRVRYDADLLELFTASDAVVCNAGYNTVSEIELCGTPCVMIPLGTTGRDDQHERAQRIAQTGRVVLGSEENPAALVAQLKALLNGELVSRRLPIVSTEAKNVGLRALSVLRSE